MTEKNDIETRRKLEAAAGVCKILPLSSVAMEIENYIERHGGGDAVDAVQRYAEPVTIVEKRGVKVGDARTTQARYFVLYYNADFSQFGVFDETEQGTDALVASWNVVPEDADGDWRPFD